MTNPIVNVNVSVQVAPAPSVLQKTGALISQGATVTAPGTRTLLTRPADLTPILTGAKAISTITWISSVATVTTNTPHGFTIGDQFLMVISGAVPAAYNGTFLITVTSPTQFTYALAISPGVNTTPGVYSPEDVGELAAMVTTFFAQGSAQSVYVLELGAGNANDGVAFLNGWITTNQNVFYSYLVPRTWDGNANFLAFLAQFEGLASKTYFFITTTLATYSLYPAAMKDAFLLIEAPQFGIWPANALTAISWGAGLVTATTTTNHGVLPGQYFQIAGCLPVGYNGYFLALPGTAGNTLSYALATNPGVETALGTLVASQYASAGVPSTEFSAAAVLRVTLNYTPSSTNKVTPLNFAFLFGVTPFPASGNAALITTLLNANVNIVGTGAQGGISSSLLLGGTLADGQPFKYWYSIDWGQINVALNMTNVLINGANNPQNPIDYNQFGINALQQSAISTMVTGIGAGLILNPIKSQALNAQDYQTALSVGTFNGFTVVNADPFATYTTENPNDYSNGVYNGISVTYTPLRGFESITVNITVSNFAG